MSTPGGSATLGYRLSPKNKCLNPRLPRSIEGQLDRDIADLTILLDPGTEHESRRYNEIDPSTLADFADARADLITGAAAAGTTRHSNPPAGKGA